MKGVREASTSDTEPHIADADAVDQLPSSSASHAHDNETVLKRAWVTYLQEGML